MQVANVWCCRLEERRKVKGQAYYERKKAARKLLADAKKDAAVPDKTKQQLEGYGYSTTA
jgi:large subunit ribosomal protein L13Ae